MTDVHPPISDAAFVRTNGILQAEQVPLPVIAAAVGTPCYVYAANTIRARYERLARAFDGVAHQIHFAMKANSSLAILRLLRSMGAGVDIVSGGELYRARLAGYPGTGIVFSGVGKTVPEIRQAFGKYLEIEHIKTISPADLDIFKEENRLIIAFAYERRIPLVANVSLLIDFRGSSSGRGF